MSTHTPKSADDQEIDLGSISRGIGKAIDGVSRFIFTSTRFFVRNIIITGILIILGVALGIFLDQGKVYNHEIMVTPNFGSADYLYSKVDLLNAKITERDTIFLKSLGIEKPKKLIEIKIKPIVDVYRFVNANELNFRVLELLSEDGDLNKIVEEKTTSKNYTYHMISLTTKGKSSDEMLITPLMEYFNQSEFFSKLQERTVANVRQKMITNDTLISQIDNILRSIASEGKGSSGGGTMVYNSQNSQLNDVIRTKDELIEEQGHFRVELIGLDKIVKKNSQSLNMIQDSGLTGKMKFILPFVFILLFVIIYNFVGFYRRQSQRYTT